MKSNETVQPSTVRVRNYGLDLLRILSILFVVTLHALGHGGVLKNADGTQLLTAYYLEALAFCAVDCFVLISGYCLCKASFKSARIVTLWAEALFYSVAIVIFLFVYDQSAISADNVIRAFFPVISNQWWFFTEYFALAICMPALNIILSRSAQKQPKLLIALIIGLFCVVPFLAHADLFKLSNGYSFAWFALLYILGGGLHSIESNAKHPSLWGFVLYMSCITLTWACYMLIHFQIIPEFFNDWGGALYTYTSPFIVLSAVGLFWMFSHLKIRSSVVIAAIKFIQPAVFAVYLISDHVLIRVMFVKGAFATFVTQPAPMLLGIVLASVLLIALFCVIVDKFRILIFKVVGIESAIGRLGSRIDRAICSRLS